MKYKFYDYLLIGMLLFYPTRKLIKFGLRGMIPMSIKDWEWIEGVNWVIDCIENRKKSLKPFAIAWLINCRYTYHIYQRLWQKKRN